MEGILHTVIDERDLQEALCEPVFWPNLSQSAGITGLSKGTLSKQAHARKITSAVRGFGHAERVLPPEEVLRIGYSYRRISEATLIDRLATFLSGRLATDVNLVQRFLWTCMETAAYHRAQAHSRLRGPSSASDNFEAPSWLIEVEHLRENPHALEGTLSFTSADDLIGTIQLGPSIDDPSRIDLAAWNAV